MFPLKMNFESFQLFSSHYVIVCVLKNDWLKCNAVSNYLSSLLLLSDRLCELFYLLVMVIFEMVGVGI